MPDIFKKLDFVESDDAVMIPDFDMGYTPAPELPQEEAEHTESEEGQSENGTPVPAWRPPPPPPPLTKAELEVKYAQELAELRDAAVQEGFEEGVRQMQGEISSCIDGAESALGEMHRLQKEYFAQFASELRFLAVDIAEKIMLQRIEEDDMALRDLVMQTVSSVKRYKWLTVEVSEQLTGLVDSLKEELERSQYGGKADVNAIPGPLDTCRVVTDTGATVASISVQVNNLREAFANEE